MKNIIYLLGLVLMSLLSSCAHHVEYTKYYSKDSIFTVNMPSDYQLTRNESDNMVWEGGTHNLAFVMVNNVCNLTDFQSFADRQANNVPSRFTVTLMGDSSDPIRHYQASTAFDREEEYYFFKDEISHKYVIGLTGNIDKEVAMSIASSFKETLKGLSKVYTKSTDTNITDTSTKDADKNIYKKEGFAISRDYQLSVNEEYIQQVNAANPDNHLIGAYYCLQNNKDANKINMININTFDISGDGVNGSDRLRAYKRCLQNAGISYQSTQFRGHDAVEYSFTENIGNSSVPTKALYVIKDGKYYVLQLASLTDVESKFEMLKSDVTFI